MDPARTVLQISGEGRVDFLQDLVTNDVTDPLRTAYAALLTPQGKYLADFFVSHGDEGLLIDVDSRLAPGLLMRLRMYRLRRKIEIEGTDLSVGRGIGPMPKGAMADPRDPGMGWRHIGGTSEDVDWDALRVAHVIPEAHAELIPEESFILEMGFERLNGVDFRKGCYVGQEIVARMKHKTVLRKGLARVRLDGAAEPGAEITAGGRPVGTLHTVSGDRALAYLRFDRAEGEMAAGEARVTRDDV